MVGLNHFIRLSNNIYWNTVLGISYSENGYDLDSVNTSTPPVRVRSAQDIEIRYAVNSFVDYKVNARFDIKGGVQCDLLNLYLQSKDRRFTPDWKYNWDFKGNTSLLAAYLEAKYRITEQFTINAGIRSQSLTLNNDVSVEPRLGLK